MSDDNKKKKPEEKNEPKMVTLTEGQEQLWREALDAARVLGDALADVGSPIREFALGLTKLQEAEMWIERGFDMLGIDTYEDGDDEDEGDEDEGDEDEGDEDEGDEDEE